ncbi:MSMEG_0565 family glycosyltransferase [Caballeronia sp. SEWSISQ10-4 2]|uniref:MSMEG_0565 family glycosyltransferase n=1 Tax=Caballeronia sp. SEWSISQ10-4 2 TaxID=2937438 RepID=UPI0026514943|nr:MSMEG_0565 family glycosyltransferase [Caballeronia sp. SEWSISQ10-4 2]MDN7183774.1 MSMEG_0565 family glycosyltransferase [Caballeronia sp. SEWSISQ10-4 2]
MMPAAMRIALTTHSVNPRGGVVHALELASALVDEGHDVTLFAPAAPGETLFREPPCRVILATIEGSQHDMVALVDARLRALKARVKACDANSFDVLHAQDSISGNALAELTAEGEIAGFVRTVHHLDHFDNPRLAAWQTRAWRDADRVLCVSEMWTRVMCATYGVEAATVPNGVDLRRYSTRLTKHDNTVRQRLGLKDGAPVVLAVGGIEARKNTLGLLDAFAELVKRRPSARLVIAGGASLLDHNAYARAFMERVGEFGLTQTVTITGPLDDADMPALFRCADVLAMVSLREGFGLVVLEALACGTPVVASKIAPFTEYLDHSLCCWATPTDTVSIANALERVIDGRHRTDFDHAVPALLNRMSWQASARKHLDIYGALLASRSLQTL